jgi:hypothetical protein
VSTFIGGTEDPEKGCRISSPQPPPPSIQYDQGVRTCCCHLRVPWSMHQLFGQQWLMQSTYECTLPCLQLGLKFPKPGAEAAHQHIIDMSVHSEALLMAAQGHTFPLIIRLETITEDGIKAGHSLQVCGRFHTSHLSQHLPTFPQTTSP